jgi:hypothetical protein
MTRRDALAGHSLIQGRRDTGARHRGGYHTYATTVGCTCGWSGAEISDAPTQGGYAKAVQAHRVHITDAISRNSLATMLRARTEWRDWQPGDGTCYRVRVITVVGGPDYSDRVLVVNVNRKAWAFQYPTAQYRIREMGPPDYRCSYFQGQAGELWRAVKPLLIAEGIIDGVES